jgi:hypothetical protein
MAAISSGPCAVRHETRKGLCRDRGRAGRRCEGPDHGAALLRAKATLLLEERLFRLSGGAPDYEQDAADLRQQRHGTLGLGNIAVRVADLLVTNGSFNSVARPPNLVRSWSIGARPSYPFRWHPFVFICPVTSMNVQHQLDDDPDAPENDYQGISCPACTRLHFINRKTGELLGQEE